MAEKLNIHEVLDDVPPWSPQVVAAVNDYDLKVANASGDFIEHVHGDTDEVFVVLTGRLHLDLPDGTVSLGHGDIFTVPRGTPHRPHAEAGTRILMVEPRGTTQDGSKEGSTGERLA